MAVKLEELQDPLAPGLGDPVLSDKWRILSFPKISEESLSPLACEELDLPFPVYQESTSERASTVLYFPKGSSIAGFNTTFGLDHKLAVIRYFTAWQNLIQNPYTGGYRLPSAYKKDITVGIYDTKGTLLCTSTMRNCWPLGLSNIQLNGQSTRLMQNIQFRCDAQYLTFV